MIFDSKLIDFFKRHNLYDKEMFNYFSKNITFIDYKEPKQRVFIGTFYSLDNDNNLIKFHLNLPYIYDDITRLINIHELVHGIILYKKLNKKIELELDKETLPMLYENIYINEEGNQELINYSNLLDELIKNKKEEYIFGLEVREELLKNYDYDIDKINNHLKRIVRKKEY